MATSDDMRPVSAGNVRKALAEKLVMFPAMEIIPTNGTWKVTLPKNAKEYDILIVNVDAAGVTQTLSVIPDQQNQYFGYFENSSSRYITVNGNTINTYISSHKITGVIGLTLTGGGQLLASLLSQLTGEVG